MFIQDWTKEMKSMMGIDVEQECLFQADDSQWWLGTTFDGSSVQCATSWNGPICESKPSNMYQQQLTCVDEGIHDLLSPTIVQELSLSNELKMEQFPSWLDILMPPLQPCNNDDIINHNYKLNSLYLQQKPNSIVEILGSFDDEAMIHNDSKEKLALIHGETLHLNPKHHTQKSAKEVSFSHNIKNRGLHNQYAFHQINNHARSEAIPNLYQFQVDVAQASKENKNQQYHVAKRKNPPLEVQSQLGKSGKLGEKMTVLQQLVSPLGKTDQASVLLEATRCIKFLQEKMQALSSPYFKFSSTSIEDEDKVDLRSKGLCLVPLSYILQVENLNGDKSLYGRVTF